MSKALQRLPAVSIESRILLVRGQKVLLDAHLAELYGVPTKQLNQQLKRNRERFPEEFAFRLTPAEAQAVRSQFVTLQKTHFRYLPYVFTEHGALMAANVLNSPRAVRMSVAIIQTFVRLRQMLASNAQLAARLEALEKKYDAKFKTVFAAIRQLLADARKPESPRREIGFHVNLRDEEKTGKGSVPAKGKDCATDARAGSPKRM
jgi:hypothetical protein